MPQPTNTLYVEPITKINKAQETMKLICLGNGVLGLRMRTDLVRAMGLKRGEMIFVTLEKANPD